MNFRQESLPPELLINIFELLSYDDLHKRCKLTCKNWKEIICTRFRYPKAIMCDKQTRPGNFSRIISRCGNFLSTLRFVGVNPLTYIPRQNDSVVFSKLTFLSLVREATIPRNTIYQLNVRSLVELIDLCPKLKRLEIRNFTLTGDSSELCQVLKVRCLQELTLNNEYLVSDSLENLYELSNMRKFNVHCLFLSDAEARRRMIQLCDNNKLTLIQLGIRIPWDGVILSSIATCAHLRELRLAGTLRSTSEWTRIMALPQLRNLDLEIDHTVSTKMLKLLLAATFVNKLEVLKIRWKRKPSTEELQYLNRICTRKPLMIMVGEEEEENGDENQASYF